MEFKGFSCVIVADMPHFYFHYNNEKTVEVSLEKIKKAIRQIERSMEYLKRKRGE